MLSSQLLHEFSSSRTLLVQLMQSAYTFLNSDSLTREFFNKLSGVSSLYDDMHDLPVVQKRKRWEGRAVFMVESCKNGK